MDPMATSCSVKCHVGEHSFESSWTMTHFTSMADFAGSIEVVPEATIVGVDLNPASVCTNARPGASLSTAT